MSLQGKFSSNFMHCSENFRRYFMVSKWMDACHQSLKCRMFLGWTSVTTAAIIFSATSYIVLPLFHNDSIAWLFAVKRGTGRLQWKSTRAEGVQPDAEVIAISLLKNYLLHENLQQAQSIWNYANLLPDLYRFKLYFIPDESTMVYCKLNQKAGRTQWTRQHLRSEWTCGVQETSFSSLVVLL